MSASPRLAVRAVIVEDGRLLVVNAYPGNQSDLFCAPGGGVEKGQSLHDNLKREVWEETGLTIAVGRLLLVNEFHQPADGFHQVEVFFAAHVVEGQIDNAWADPEDVVHSRRFVTEAELQNLRFKPEVLQQLAFGPDQPATYDPLELKVD